VELTNVSSVDIAYEVDIKPLANLKEDNYGQPLLRLANPRGTVPALSTATLDWYFYPLEVKTYDVELEVRRALFSLIRALYSPCLDLVSYVPQP